MIVNPNETLWVEKFRPTCVNDCILQERLKKEANSIVASGEIPNMLFYGTAGTGKTTLARAICEEIGVDWIIINASNERGLDVIREKISTFASTASLTSNKGKCVILDEGDRLLPATQDAFKAEIETFSSTCSFIMTANHPNRLIDPLRSRLVGIDFSVNKSESERMMAEFYGRLCDILDYEGVKYDDAVLIQVIQRFFPDNRRILGELQLYSRGAGEINEGILMQIEEASIDTLIQSITSRKFKGMAQWAADNANNDTTDLYVKIYKELKNFVKSDSIPDAICIINDYQRYDSVVPSKELHLSAMATELAMNLEFK